MAQTMRIGKNTEEELNRFCIKRFHCEIQYISKDFLIKTLLEEYNKLTK